MIIVSSEITSDGFSKNKFSCCLCKEAKYAHEFTVNINGLQTRELRIICSSCVPIFNLLPTKNKIELVQKRIEEYHGEKQFIYGLFEPASSKLKYIGRTNDTKKRYQRHLQQAKEYQKKLDSLINLENELSISFHSSKKWIADLIKSGFKPEMKVIEEVKPTVKVCEQEMRWICQSIKEREDILNVENFSNRIKTLISSCKFSFKTVPLDLLIDSNFISEMDKLTSHLNRESGWRKAVLIHNAYKENIDLFASY